MHLKCSWVGQNFRLGFYIFFLLILPKFIYDKKYFGESQTQKLKEKKKEPAEFHNVNYFIISQGNLKPLMVKNYQKKLFKFSIIKNDIWVTN